jgi:hypothetical protein
MPMPSQEPDLQLAGLSIWGVRRAYPQSEDYWDGNWLNIQARVEAPGSHVEITPDHMTQSHSFMFEIDQSYLAATLAQCHRLQERFPVKSPD